MINRYYRKIENLPLLLSILGEPIGFIRNVKEPKIERILDDIDIVEFSLFGYGRVDAELEILYKNNRYIVTKVEEVRDSDGMKYSHVECMSGFVELNRTRVEDIEFTNIATQAGIKRILADSGWTVDYVEPVENEYLHSMSESNKSTLWMLRQFAMITGYEIKFDTVNKTVSFVIESGIMTDEVIRFKKNMKEIKKTTEPTRATVIFPRGRGGLTIQSVNSGVEYLEDYSWYTDVLGISLSEAKRRFKKEIEWEDKGFIYAGTLMREGKKKIWQYSRPQISYETKVVHIGVSHLNVGDYAYIIDDDLGVRLSVRVVRIVDYPGQEWRNEIEFSYLTPGLGSVQEGSGDYDQQEEQTVVVKNESDVSIGTTYQALIELSLSAYASTNLQAGLHFIGQATEKTLISAYFTFRGVKVGPEIRQTVDAWQTIGLPLILTQVQEGSGFLQLFVKVDNGIFTVKKHGAELYIKGQNLLGGLSAELPKANVVEEVKYTKYEVIDRVSTNVQVPIPVKKAEVVEYVPFTVTDKVISIKYINKGSLIPIMLSNETPTPYFVVANTTEPGYGPYRAMDKDPGKTWMSENGTLTSQISLNLGSDKLANYYRVTGVADATKNPKTWVLEGSASGTEWIALDTQTNVVFDGVEEKEFFIASPLAYRLYRWTFAENNGSLTNIAVTELDLINR